MHRTSELGVLALALVGTAAGCGSEQTSSAPTDTFEIVARPLTLDEITSADYGIAVYNSLNQLVWEKPHVTSEKYGDGRGAIAFVGPCDASASPNRVELVIHDLVTTGAWANPTASGPLVQYAACVPNRDTSVVFDITILRAAEQGFFDIAVNFEDIFCSAKLDCVDELLHRPGGGGRGPTVNVAFACTAGPGQDTWLHFSDVAVICGGVYTWLDPSRGPGQVGGEGEAIWQFATYRGQEAVALDKCYWNLAIGLDVGEGGAAEDCRLVAYATASHASFGDKRRSPENTVYPYVAYEVQLTNSSADFMCNGAPLDGGGGVHTGYTLPRGKDFPWEWECSPTAAIFESRVLCAGQTGPDAATFVDTPGGIVFGFGDKLSPLYTLPDDRHIRGCCANPCPKCAP